MQAPAPSGAPAAAPRYVPGLDGGQTPAAALAAAHTAAEPQGPIQRHPRTRRGRTTVQGMPMEVIVQEFSNNFVVIATQIGVPGACYTCRRDAALTTDAVTYTVTPTLGGHENPVGTVIARQLVSEVSSSPRAQELILYLGIHPRVQEEDPAAAIAETIKAIQACRLW
eukprot:TRINITY_DN7274_c0_g1_i1.p1 TRINITY_DN7274_c0_g1~~TRINITY_DN7274_c0_g1_i1.p1  ORF type:complete len:196 (+),score=48.62 TRINITY_DN7274_c0_g1_i1:85-588(+)